MNINNLVQCIITVTRNCNLRCEFCYAKEEGYDATDYVELDKITKIIDICNEAKAKYIFLTGGEPTLYPHIFDLLDYIKGKAHNMIPTIATNGILLADYNYCKRLLDCGIGYVDVSLKGKDEREWMKVSKYDGFMKQLKAIENLATIGAEITCSMVITRNNVSSFCKSVRNAYNAGARNFSFTFVIDNEQSEQQDLQYLVNNNPIKLVDEFLTQIDELNRITKGEWWIEYSFPLCVFTPEQLTKLEHRLAKPCYVRNSDISTLEFDTGLNLIPCSMFLDEKMGKFGVDFHSFSDIEKYVNKDPYQKIIDAFRNLPAEDCEVCKYQNECLGGCPWFWKHCSFEAFRKFKTMSGRD